MTSSLSFPGCSHPGFVMAPSHGFRLRRSGRLVASGSSELGAAQSVHSFSRFVTFWRLCGASWSPPLFPRSLRRALAYCLAAWPLPHYRWSRVHGRTSAGPSSESDRFVVLPRQLVGSGVCSPASTICPPSSVVKQSSFWLSASVSHRVFAMKSPFRVESVSVLDRNEDSSSTFLVFSWSLHDEVTLSGRVCLRSRSEQRLFAHLP